MNLNSFISVDDVKNAGDHENNENNEENEENNNSGETNGQTFVGEQLSFTKPKD
jgi:hypothetical protein